MVVVSVIVPTWNNEDVLEGCLSSLEKQSYNNLEVIIVDNFSNQFISRGGVVI